MTATIPVDTINQSMEGRLSCMKGWMRTERTRTPDVSSALTYAPLSANTCAVSGVDTDVSEYELRIPRFSPEGRVVVAVADRAFEGNTACRRVTLPASVTVIGERAFAFCTALRLVEFGKHSHLDTVGKRAFIGCESLSDIALPASVRECGVKAFAHCTALKSIRLGAGMTTLTSGVLEGCRNLVNVVLPEGLVTVECSAMSSCVSLRSLHLPASVQTVEDCAFAWCAHLADVSLPALCHSLSPKAFYQCPALFTRQAC